MGSRKSKICIGEVKNKSIILKPDYPDAYNNLGLNLQSKNKFDEAYAKHGSHLSTERLLTKRLKNAKSELRYLFYLEKNILIFAPKTNCNSKQITHGKTFSRSGKQISLYTGEKRNILGDFQTL